MKSFQIRTTTKEDIEAIFDLYKRVSKTLGGLARNEHEITRDYVNNFTMKSLLNGCQLVAVLEDEPQTVVAEIHCYRLEPTVFSHILSELTIAVDAQHQGQGLGKQLFQALLNHVQTNCHDILRVELIARESNIKAIRLYENLGFIIEGKLQNRIKNHLHELEADIPMAWFNPNFNI